MHIAYSQFVSVREILPKVSVMACVGVMLDPHSAHIKTGANCWSVLHTEVGFPLLPQRQGEPGKGRVEGWRDVASLLLLFRQPLQTSKIVKETTVPAVAANAAQGHTHFDDVDKLDVGSKASRCKCVMNIQGH